MFDLADGDKVFAVIGLPELAYYMVDVLRECRY